jgi:hypothetical protein
LGRLQSGILITSVMKTFDVHVKFTSPALAVVFLRCCIAHMEDKNDGLDYNTAVAIRDALNGCHSVSGLNFPLEQDLDSLDKEIAKKSA